MPKMKQERLGTISYMEQQRKVQFSYRNIGQSNSVMGAPILFSPTHTDTNTQTQIHRHKYTDTNTQTPTS